MINIDSKSFALGLLISFIIGYGFGVASNNLTASECYNYLKDNPDQYYEYLIKLSKKNNKPLFNFILDKQIDWTMFE